MTFPNLPIPPTLFNLTYILGVTSKSSHPVYTQLLHPTYTLQQHQQYLYHPTLPKPNPTYTLQLNLTSNVLIFCQVCTLWTKPSCTGFEAAVYSV